MDEIKARQDRYEALDRLSKRLRAYLRERPFDPRAVELATLDHTESEIIAAMERQWRRFLATKYAEDGIPLTPRDLDLIMRLEIDSLRPNG